jgi:hypothetical protein
MIVARRVLVVISHPSRRNVSMLTRAASGAFALAVVFLSAATVGRPAAQQAAVQAIVGGTVIDGNGGPPIRDGIIVVTGQRITAIGPRSSVRMPPGATVIDAAGKYVVPGFIDGEERGVFHASQHHYRCCVDETSQDSQ